MYDLVIRNGTVVDGTGLPSYRADVAVSGDRIAAIGRIRERGREELVRRRPARVTAEPHRLVGDQAVLPVDHDLLAERAGDRACCRGEPHRPKLADSLLPGNRWPR